jgi:hypothetical protein
MRSPLISLTFSLSVLVLKATSIEDSLFGDAELSDLSLFGQDSDQEETWALLDLPPNEDGAWPSQDAFGLFGSSLQSSEPLYPDPSASLWDDELAINPVTSASPWDDALALESSVQDEMVDDSFPILDPIEVVDGSFQDEGDSFQDLNDPLEIVDCSTLDNSHYGKSRVKRYDAVNACPNPLTDSPSLEPIRIPADKTARDDLKRWTEKYPNVRALIDTTKPNENPFCKVISDGRLPYGFCPSSNPDDTWQTGQIFFLGGAQFPFWELRNPTATRAVTFKCPKDRKQLLHCCQGGNMVEGQYHALNCVKAVDLHGDFVFRQFGKLFSP